MKQSMAGLCLGASLGSKSPMGASGEVMLFRQAHSTSRPASRQSGMGRMAPATARLRTMGPLPHGLSFARQLPDGCLGLPHMLVRVRA